MIPGNNFSEIQVLRQVEESIMDMIARARAILARTATVDELRQSFLEINEKQAVYEAKLDEILRIHNKRHEEFQICFARCRELIRDMEEAEDRIQCECFRLLDRDAEDADAITAQGIAANKTHTSWLHRHLQGLKQLFSREGVRA